MSLLSQIGRLMRLLWVSGGRLRCPNCAEGRLFHGLGTLQPMCTVCGVRFERLDGESIGGMAITLVFVPSLALVGFFLMEFTTNIAFSVNAGIWFVLLVIGCAVAYRHSRGAWIAVSYITGGVYADAPPPDTTAQRQQIMDAVRASRNTTPPQDIPSTD